LKRNVLVVQHTPEETPGIVAQVLQESGYELHTINTVAEKHAPSDHGDAAALIVMGGPMGVYETGRYPFLLDELRLLENALKANIPILGVCLGSELLAKALGAKVYQGKQKEIGWFPVTLTEDARHDALWREIESPVLSFHWHGDVFELPKGAVSLARSEHTECQAFRYESNAYGFLFHAEVTPMIAQGMIRAFAEELRQESIPDEVILHQTKQHLPKLMQTARSVFSRWVGLIGR
jgi:GMP synthase (glutamine-hydrolysing)